MDLIKSVQGFAGELTVSGILLLALFGLYKEWWFLGGPVKKERADHEETKKVLKETTAELNETKITLTVMKAVQEAKEAKPRRGTG